MTAYYNSRSPVVSVPDLADLTQSQATSALNKAGLNLGVVTTQSSSAVQGTVIAQSLPAGQQVARGSTVNIVLAGGPPTVAIPDVLNTPFRSAETALQSLGFEVRVTWVKGTGMAMGQVVRVTPAVDTAAPQGSLVVLTVEETGK